MCLPICCMSILCQFRCISSIDWSLCVGPLSHNQHSYRLWLGEERERGKSSSCFPPPPPGVASHAKAISQESRRHSNRVQTLFNVKPNQIFVPGSLAGARELGGGGGVLPRTISNISERFLFATLVPVSIDRWMMPAHTPADWQQVGRTMCSTSGGVIAAYSDTWDPIRNSITINTIVTFDQEHFTYTTRGSEAGHSQSTAERGTSKINTVLYYY